MLGDRRLAGHRHAGVGRRHDRGDDSAVRALQPVELLISGWRALIDARAAWGRLEERNVSATPQMRALPAGADRTNRRRAACVQLFGDAPAADPQHRLCRSRAGESLGIIGPSASGKTTLIRLMLGLWRPQAGVVRLDGADIARWDRTDLGAHIGYLPQDVELFSGTVAENIARLSAKSGPEASERHRARRATGARPRNDSPAPGWLRDADR